jgi:hypothetical protein
MSTLINSMRFLIIFYLSITNHSCECVHPNFVHIDFCDFLNTSTTESWKDHTKEVFEEKTLNYVIEESDSRCFADSVIDVFIKSDGFIQKEIQHAYYRLNIFFYKKSEFTNALLKMRSNKYLDYCDKDIIVEYQWVEGILKRKYLYKNGGIQGEEKIILDQEK